MIHALSVLLAAAPATPAPLDLGTMATNLTDLALRIVGGIFALLLAIACLGAFIAKRAMLAFTTLALAIGCGLFVFDPSLIQAVVLGIDKTARGG